MRAISQIYLIGLSSMIKICDEREVSDIRKRKEVHDCLTGKPFHVEMISSSSYESAGPYLNPDPDN